MKRTALVAAGVSVLAVVVSSCASSEERSARDDVAAVSAVVAEYVVEHGELPRVTVTTLESDNYDVLVPYGEDFLVESRHVPRADPSLARLLFVVGDADHWCVETNFSPPAILADGSTAWVAARGEVGEVGQVRDGRCGDEYVLFLSPVTQTGVPEPGSVVDAASAPIGTCLAGLIPDGGPTGLVEVVGCESAHFAEIYHSAEVEVGDYGQYQNTAQETCAEAFSSFVGVPRNFSWFSSEPFIVSEAQWQTGVRKFSCVLYLGSEDYPLVGSARDSWR